MLNKLFDFMFGHWKMELKHFPFKTLLQALKLWSINLVIPISFVIVSPLFLFNLSDFFLGVFSIFKFWLVDGFKYQMIFYVMCLLFTITEEL